MNAEDYAKVMAGYKRVAELYQKAADGYQKAADGYGTVARDAEIFLGIIVGFLVVLAVIVIVSAVL
jgi:tetrahydromethanopterin S-methyltransferase subunit G